MRNRITKLLDIFQRPTNCYFAEVYVGNRTADGHTREYGFKGRDAVDKLRQHIEYATHNAEFARVPYLFITVYNRKTKKYQNYLATLMGDDSGWSEF